MELHGIPAVHICTVTPISVTVGAPRIFGGFAIPYPTGNPNLTEQKELDFRKNIVQEALQMLTQMPNEG